MRSALPCRPRRPVRVDRAQWRGRYEWRSERACGRQVGERGEREGHSKQESAAASSAPASLACLKSVAVPPKTCPTEVGTYRPALPPCFLEDAESSRGGGTGFHVLGRHLRGVGPVGRQTQRAARLDRRRRVRSKRLRHRRHSRERERVTGTCGAEGGLRKWRPTPKPERQKNLPFIILFSLFGFGLARLRRRRRRRAKLDGRRTHAHVEALHTPG